MLSIRLSLHSTSAFSQNFEIQFKTPPKSGSEHPKLGKGTPVSTPGAAVPIQLQGINSVRGEAQLHHLHNLHYLFSCPAASTELGLALAESPLNQLRPSGPFLGLTQPREFLLHPPSHGWDSYREDKAL